MSTRSERLAAFLAAGARLPFVWGERDCCLWVADWIVAERGIDPARHLRGRYASAHACHRLLRQHGGFSALIAPAMLRAGLPETGEPRVGDVGIVRAAAGPMMAIHAGTGWALKCVDGIAVLPAAPAAMWRI